VCIILECFVNFLDDPYYEPLLWFMIIMEKWVIFCKSLKIEKTIAYAFNNVLLK